MLGHRQKKNKQTIVHIVLLDEPQIVQNLTRLYSTEYNECRGLQLLTLCVKDKDKSSCEIYSYLSTPAKGAVVQFKSRTLPVLCASDIGKPSIITAEKQGNINLPVIDKISLLP